MPHEASPPTPRSRTIAARILGSSAVLIAPLLILVVFSRLVAHPGFLIADAIHEGNDHAVPEDGRSVGNDLTRLFLPHHARIATEVARSGRVPGWDPAGFGGRPLVGNPQAGLWYPPVWVAWACWTPSALGWLTIAHLAIGSIGVFVLARGERLGRFASAVAAGLWATSPYLLAQVYEGHYPHVWAASLYPWAFWSAGGWRDVSPRRWLLPPILAMACLAGHVQEAYLLGLGLFGWVACESFFASKPFSSVEPGAGWRRMLAEIGQFVPLCGLALGMIAIEVLPVLLARGYSVKAFRPTASDAAKYHVSLENLWQIVCPFALGRPRDYRGSGSYWETLLAFGWTPVLLALGGVRRAVLVPSVRPWVALCVVGSLFGFGRFFGVFDLVYAVVPGMGLFRVPSRSLFLVALGVAMLAGHGVEGLACGTILPNRGRKAVILGALALPIAIVFVIARGEFPVPLPVSSGVELGSFGHRGPFLTIVGDPRFVAAFWGSVLVGVGLARWPAHRVRFVAILGGLALVEMSAYGFALIRVADPSRFLGPDPVGRAIAVHRPPGAFRIRSRDAFYGDARAFALGIEKTNLHDSYQIRHAADLYERLYPMFGAPSPPRFRSRYRAEVQRAVLRLMNVGLLVSDRDDDRLEWPVATRGNFEGEAFTVRRDPSFLPRAYVVPRAEVLPDGPGVVDRFEAIDPREAVVLDRDPLPDLPSRQPFTPADYRTDGPDRVEIRVRTRHPGLLVVADTWMPGWEAESDGLAVPILRGNHWQRVIALDGTGTHRIVMTYRPPGLAVGRAISLASFAAWGVVAGVSLLRNRARSRPRESKVPGPCSGP